MIIFILICIVVLIAAIAVLVLLYINQDENNKNEKMETTKDILEKIGFFPNEIHNISRSSLIATNTSNTKIIYCKNFNLNHPERNEYFEIATSLITKIEKTNFSIRIFYSSRGDIKPFFIYPASKKIKDFIYRIYKDTQIRRIESKFKDCHFTLSSACNWEGDYIWAYDSKKNIFAYFKTQDKPAIYKINLRKELFTIDTKYKYFEAPIFGIPQQLFIYEDNFLDELFNCMIKTIKEKTASISGNRIFFDNHNNIIYLSNGYTSIQSIIISKIEEVFYRDNRLIFTLQNSEKTINYICDKEFTVEFEEFMTNYNLKNIAQNFDYKTDKLINTTQNTKFIIDTTRDRMIYCANLNKFSHFTYMSISFSNLEDVYCEKSGLKSFVRIYTQDNEIIDVSCDKSEVAYYIEAQLKNIINK